MWSSTKIPLNKFAICSISFIIKNVCVLLNVHVWMCIRLFKNFIFWVHIVIQYNCIGYCVKLLTVVISFIRVSWQPLHQPLYKYWNIVLSKMWNLSGIFFVQSELFPPPQKKSIYTSIKHQSRVNRTIVHHIKHLSTLFDP